MIAISVGGVQKAKSEIAAHVANTSSFDSNTMLRSNTPIIASPHFQDARLGELLNLCHYGRVFEVPEPTTTQD